jgi:hypothetical protein
LSFVELHARSAFSFLRGASVPEDYAAMAASLDLVAMAMTDCDGLYGSARFYLAMRKAGLRGHTGAEVLCTDGGRYPLLVKNRTGYNNLCRLITRTKLRTPKHPKPGQEAAATPAELEEFAEGLICLTGDGQGPLAAALRREEGRMCLDGLMGIFGRGNVYVELQRHHDRDEEARNQEAIALARSAKLPIIASNGVCHARPVQREILDVFLCLHHKTTLAKAGKLLTKNAERHLKSAQQMNRLFADYPEAIANTVEASSQLGFQLTDLGYEFPRYPVPRGQTEMEFLRARTLEAGRLRYQSGHGGENGGSGGSDYGTYISGGTVSSVGGNILIDGNTGGSGTLTTSTGASNYGISNTGTVSTTGSATITMNGIGGGSGNSGSDYGVYISTGGIISAVNSNISVMGTGGGAGTGGTNIGVFTTGSGSTIKTIGSGNVSVIGTGGNATGSGVSNEGVQISGSNGIQAAGTGKITVNGTGSASTAGDNTGIFVNGSVTGASGDNITVTGITTGSGSGSADNGVYITGAINTSGSGTITLSGTASGTTGGDDYGIVIPGGSISTGNGNLSVTGNSSGTSTGNDNDGVALSGAGVISSVNGAVSVTGTGNGTNSAVNSNGVQTSGTSSIETTGSGNVSVTGTSSTGDSVGVAVANTNGIQTTGTGNITVNGNGMGAYQAQQAPSI